MRRLSDPAALCTALVREAINHLLLRDSRTALERAKELLLIATEHGMRIHAASPLFIEGGPSPMKREGRKVSPRCHETLPAFELRGSRLVLRLHGRQLSQERAPGGGAYHGRHCAKRNGAWWREKGTRQPVSASKSARTAALGPTTMAMRSRPLSNRAGVIDADEDGTSGSQCLVAGAEEIRNAGPLCAPDIQGRLVSQEIFNAAIAKKPHGGIFFGAIYRHGRAENELISSCLSEGTTRFLGG